MPRTPVRAAVCFAMLTAAASVANADEGMWLPNKPPLRLLKQRYGFEPTADWLDQVQKSCCRFSTGGSGSFVSPNGLVMTNHHVGYDMLEKLSTPERNLLKAAFYARTPDEEPKCPDLELLVLWTIEDVTDRVNSAVRLGMPAAEANVLRRKRIAEIEDESKKTTNLQSEVVTLYHGARYHLYRYQRYTDVRLVFAPEEQAAFFGGDNDNFEYPRFNLDCCFFRVYENDQPLRTEHHLKWSRNGSSEGELTFVAGHPGRTQRLFTVEHLRFLRDVETPMILRRIWRREVQLNNFASRSEEFARISSGDRRGYENSRKAFTGIMAGLLDPAIMKAKADAEATLRAAVDAHPKYKADWGDAWDQIARAYAAYREFYPRLSSLEGRRSVIRSDLFGIARHLVRLADEKPKPGGERLREYRDSELPLLELELFSPAPIYDDLEIDRIASGLSYFAETNGGDDPDTRLVLGGMSPRAKAEMLVRGTRLKDVNYRKKLYEGGRDAIAKCDDPMIRFYASIDPEARKLRKRFEDEVESVEREAYAKVAAAQFAINGEDMYPDATFTLRLSVGAVKGYEENGRTIAPYTTLAGMYERMNERHGVPPFDLPPIWLSRKDRLDLSTAYNFVTTNDIIGGNSGSPVFNKAAEVVGLVFDGNIQGLVWDIAYTDAQARCVAVDSRAIIEAMRKVYDAGPLADEITGAAAGQARAAAAKGG